MEPTTPSRSPGQSSFVVDIEKADDPYGEPVHLNSPSPANTTPFTSPKGPFVSPASAAAGPLIGLKNLFDRNPATVVSGRYSINLRQLFVLILILMGLTTLWFVVNPPERFGGAEGSESLVQSAVGVSDQDRIKGNHPHAKPNMPAVDNPSPLVLEASHGLTGSAKFRFERVRGKGARTSLKKIQFQFPAETQKARLERESRLKAVRDGFEHAWKGYRTHAWGHDEVQPVAGGFRDTFNGWGATMVDSLDTLVIMGFNDEFDEALEWIRTKFDMTKNPTDQIQFFETVIRYLGGFLSTYDLTGEKVLLDKAEELGKYLLNAFQGKNFPNGRFAVQASANSPGYGFVLAEVGTIQLEFSRLSMLTGNPIYDTKVHSVRSSYERHKKHKEERWMWRD
jgi:mannosyl-oligosaccharide alpha-1,2-mannosidase